jgi:ElaB/YqjD/DUF883 family membrane-anchored ribosome-binding protein
MFARSASRRSAARRAARVLHQQPVQVATEEVRILISRVDDLLARLNAATDPELKRLHKQAEAALSDAQSAMTAGGTQLADQVRDIAEQGGRYVRRSPWTSLGLVALGMLAIGLFTGRSVMSD